MASSRARATPALLYLTLLASCPGPRPSAPPPREAPPPARPSAPRTVEAPTLRVALPASHYLGPSPGAAVAPDLQWLLAEANRILDPQGGALTWDLRLAAAARSLTGLRSLAGLSSAALVFALRGAGVAEPHARLLAEDLPAGDATWRPALLARLLTATTTGGHTLVGGALRAAPGGQRRVVLVLLRSHLRLGPVPRQPTEDASILLRGALTRGYSAARVVVTAPDGASRTPRLVASTDGSFHAVVPLSGGAGVYQVEILGSGPGGPEVLANFPLFVGVAAPDRLLLRPRVATPAADPARAAGELWGRIQEARRQAGGATLAWHAGLARVARAHAHELCRRQEVRHLSAETGSAADRVARAGLRVRWVGENVGRATTVGEVDRELMQSPGHRATRLHGVATHGAVGVCVQRRAGGVDLYVTELFVRLAP